MRLVVSPRILTALMPSSTIIKSRIVIKTKSLVSAVSREGKGYLYLPVFSLCSDNTNRIRLRGAEYINASFVDVSGNNKPI